MIVDRRARLDVQKGIDEGRSALERNRMGQFATPPELAASITREALRLFGTRTIRFLEPALGTGAFFEALVTTVDASRIESALGVELDPTFADASQRLWRGSPLRIRNEDFTLARPERHERFNLVLTNPPYVRHHHLEPAHKAALVRASEGVIGGKVSGLSGLYIHFALLAHRWLEEGAVCAWLIPSEFMDVNYGDALKSYMLDRVELLRVHRFCPSDVRFSDALVTSTVVFFRNATAPADHRVRFSYGPDLEMPELEGTVSVERLRTERKWSRLPAEAEEEGSDVVRLGDLVTIRRGIATGDNGFFILSRERASELGIPSEFLRPVLPSPRHLRQEAIERADDGFPILDRSMVLIDCKVPEADIERAHPRFYRYLQEGKRQKVDEGYLARSRTIWYSQEARKPSPLLCTYMGRSRDGRSPFRIILNRSEAIATNVYLMLYPKPWLQPFADHAGVLASRIREVGAASFTGEGRVYGGGLHKLEPKELARLPLEVPPEWRAAIESQPSLDL